MLGTVLATIVNPMPWPLFTTTPAIGLALQGGGAHGAFTWGVLDALLEAGGFSVAAISGTSAGAVNAVALAHGLALGGPDGARESLQRVWTAVGTRVPFEFFTVGEAGNPGLAPAAQAMLHWARLFSPYQLNPLGVNPLRELLAEQIDFERLREPGAVRLFVAATHANSGRLRLFGNAELSVDAVLASACLPTLHPAVTIAGEPYWDGGYSANPALFPLVESGIADLLVVMLSPLVYDEAPTQAEAIRHRALDFAFNAPFLREASLLGRAAAMARASRWSFGRLERRLRALRTHLIDAHDDLSGLRSETRLIAHLPFLERLRDLGRARAQRWLREHSGALGRRASVDLETLFAAPSPAGAPA